MAHRPLKKRRVSPQSDSEIGEAARSGGSLSVSASHAESTPHLNGNSKHHGQADGADDDDAVLQDDEHQNVSEASSSRKDNAGPVLQPSLFGLQCEQLIRNFPPRYPSKSPPVDRFVRSLKKIIECAKPIGPLPVS